MLPKQLSSNDVPPASQKDMSSKAKEKCQVSSLNLLRHLENGSTESKAIIKNILATNKCDQFYNMEDVRNCTENHLNAGDPERVDRLKKNAFSDLDREIANEVVFEYREWYVRELTRSLSYSNWIQYELTASQNSVFRGVVAAAICGFGGALGGFALRKCVAGSVAVSLATMLPKWLRPLPPSADK
jgi:hypothetical protein